MSLQINNCTLTVLDRVDSIGLAFYAEAGLLSASSLALVIVLLIRNVLRYKKYASAYKWSLVQQPVDVYVLSLLVADVLQSIGSSMSAKWVHDGTVAAGRFCTAQGVIQQLGRASVGLATTSIAIHTFVCVWMRKQHSVRTAVIIVAVSWTFIALFVGIASGLHKNYIEPSPFWCWVSPGYKQERIWGEYFWLWLTLSVAIAVYLPLFLWNQGYITIDEQYWWKVTWYWKAAREGGEARERPRASSLAILAYPVAYSIVVLPMSIVRWITFAESEPTCDEKKPNSDVPTAATFAAVFLFGSMGFVNVLLLLTTRQTLLLFDDPRDQRQVRLRRAAGGALEDGGDGAQLNANGTGSQAPSPRGNFLGSGKSSRGNSTNKSARESIFNEKNVGVDGSPTFNGGEVMRSKQRAVSLDAGRDMSLKVVTREVGWRQGSGAGRYNTDAGGLQPPPHGSTKHLLGRLHSKSSSGGSGHAQCDADEYSDEEIARRLTELTTSQSMSTNTAKAGAIKPAQRWDS